MTPQKNKQRNKNRDRNRGIDFQAPDLPIKWANTGGLSVLRLHFWQTEQIFSSDTDQQFLFN